MYLAWGKDIEEILKYVCHAVLTVQALFESRRHEFKYEG